MDINEALTNVNAAFLNSFGRALNDVETALIRGTWENQTYGQIADIYGYSDGYLRCDIAQKLWRQLGIAWGEPVTKKNFRSTVERRWQKQVNTTSQGLEFGRATVQLSAHQHDERENVECEDVEWESGALEENAQNNGAESNAAQSNTAQNIGELENSELESGELQSGEQVQDSTVNRHTQADWGEALEAGVFHGRTGEFEILDRWMFQDRCRLVTLLGLGGIGKTTLMAKFAREKQDRFDYVIWRSLRNAPALEHLLEELVLFLSDQQDREATLKQLVHWLTASRCLVILDNFESILLPGERVGHYKAGYERYGELLNVIGEASHQSCILLTSREKPTEISMLEGTGLGVRAHQLRGSLEASIGVIRAKGLKGTDLEKRALCERYACIPLAIKIAAGSIGELFDGQIGPFLDEGECLFSGTQRLLDMQFGRLSPLQQTIMFWLAINRTYTSIPELAGDIVPSINRARVLEALEALSGRSLVEKRAGHFTQQPVVMEFVTARLIELAVSEIESGELSLLIDLALLKATAVEFIRESQQHVIIEPIVSVFLAKYRDPETVAQTFVRCLKNLRDRSLPVTGYGGGNILNLLRSLPIEIDDYDFSNLSIWQAYLQGISLRRINFSGANFFNTSFFNAFGSIHTVTTSPDNRLFAAAGTSSEIKLWQVADGHECSSLSGHDGWIWSIAFSPDGKWLASGSADQTVKLWDVCSGNCVKTFSGHTNWVRSVKFSPDGQMLASGCSDHTIILWDLESGSSFKQLKGHTNYVQDISFSPNSQLIASASWDKSIRIWNVDSGQCLREIKQDKSIWSVDFSPNCRTIASGSTEDAIEIWDIRTGKCLSTLAGHTNAVRTVAFSPDGRTLASGSGDRTIKLWNVPDGRCLKTLSGHRNWIWSLAFSANGKTLVSGSEDRTVRVWDAHKGQCLQALTGYANTIRAVAFSPNAKTLVSGGDSRTVHIWDMEQARCQQRFTGHDNWILSLAFHPDGRFFASSSADQTVKIWDLKTQSCVKTLLGHVSTVWTVEFSPDGQTLASGGHDGTVRLWNIRDGRCFTTLKHPSQVRSIAFSPDGHQLVSACSDHQVRVWQVNDGQCLKVLSGHTSMVWSVAYSPIGSVIASASSDKTIRLWDANTGECINRLKGHQSWIWTVVFSPQGDRLASGCADKTAKVWDVSDGSHITLVGHTNGVRSLAFNPQGNRLVSVSDDESIRLWDIEANVCTKILRCKRPYEGTNITGASGLTASQKTALRFLGAVDDADNPLY